MTQITKRALANDSVDENKIKLSNNAYVRARNFANSADLSVLKLNTSDLAEFGVKPQSSFTPSANNDLVNVSYLASYVAGIRDLKDAVRATATTNIALATMPASIDSITLSSGDRFAVVRQTTSSQNGIYIFNGTGSPATRATDADETVEVTQGLSFDTVEGLVNAGRRWLLTTSGSITVGTTSLTFVLVPNGPAYTLRKLEQKTLVSGDITNQYVDLANLAVTQSIEVFFQGVMQKQGTDYTVSTASTVSRLTFTGDLATGGAIALVATDTLEVYYSHEVVV
jgi:hypothetical protein